MHGISSDAFSETAVISGLKKAYPDATIICMTNYDRFPSKNARGYTDIDYVKAMQQVCKKQKVLCYDCYHNSPVRLRDAKTKRWADEGIYLGEAANGHFSPEGYDALVPAYERFLAENMK